MTSEIFPLEKRRKKFNQDNGPPGCDAKHCSIPDIKCSETDISGSPSEIPARYNHLAQLLLNYFSRE
jgi:hypothetical protein